MDTHASPRPPSAVDLSEAGAPAGAAGGVPLGLSTIQTKLPPPGSLSISAAYLRASRCRASILSRANLLNMQLAEAGAPFWCAFLTLTYAKCDAWNAGHIREFNLHVRKFLGNRGHAFPYVWCAELQKRGAVHFHELVFLPNGTMLPKPDQRGWWPHGMSKIERARNAVPYIAKYAGKMITTDRFPAGLRLTGAGGLDEYSRSHARYVALPGYVRKAFAFGSAIARAPGGGFVDLDTGEIVRGEFEFVGRGEGILNFRKRSTA